MKVRVKKRWMQNAVKHPGALRKSLGAKSGQPIPISKVEAATHSDNKKLAARARLALTFRKFRK